MSADNDDSGEGDGGYNYSNYLIDIYNFQNSFGTWYSISPTAYPFSYTWYGPGPEVQARESSIPLGQTTASLLVPPMPDHLSVVSDTTQVLNCTIGTTELRAIKYNILDVNQIMISRPISVFERCIHPIFPLAVTYKRIQV